MEFFVIAFFAFAAGVFAGYFLSEPKRRGILQREQELADEAQRLHRASEAFEATAQKRAEEWSRRNDEILRQHEIERERIRAAEGALKAEIVENDRKKAVLESKLADVAASAVSFEELKNENAVLKRDLRNLDINTRKLRLDQELLQELQGVLNEKIGELGSRYLKDNVKWIGTSLNANNFAACKQRLLDVIERCRGIGFPIPPEEESELIANLKAEYQKVVRAAFEREEQTRLKAQIREEQLRQKEIDRELKQLEREREAIQAALEKALAKAKDQHSEEVERLQKRLEEAESKQRTISQAQLTKSGHVYVISNIGSFGEGVFKVGMTRRLEPMDRVRELGDASVPFPFDVHMMISSNNAPNLENALHRLLHKNRMNKTNPRKEFFKTDINTIAEIVKENHGEVEFVADAEALQYRQSLSMTDEDEEFIENTWDELEEEEDSKTIPDGM